MATRSRKWIKSSTAARADSFATWYKRAGSRPSVFGTAAPTSAAWERSNKSPQHDEERAT
eukprot:1205007-Lingulodinium_polyedra.AAC.1